MPIVAKHRTINRGETVPTIRFANFQDGWEEKKFGDLFEFKQTNSLSRDALNYEKGKVRNIHYGDIHTKFRANFDVTREKVPFINDDIDISNIKGDNHCIEGDLVIADASEDFEDIGKAIEVRNLNGEKVVAGLHTLIARPKEDLFAPGFLSYLMRSKTVRLQIKMLAQGTKVLGIAPRHLSEVLFKIPKKSEQRKIASFLELVDGFTENLRTQKDALQEYKKGMMQKIFAQEIRFKDDKGKSFPRWEEKELGEVLKERKEFSRKGKGYTHISLTTQGVVPKSERYDRDFLVGDDEAKGYKITRLNDLCYNPANLKFGVISINKLSAGIFSPIYVTFEIVGQNIDFVGYYLIRDAFINKARRYEQGTVYERMAVHPLDFVKIKLAFPSLAEQEKIANFLTSIVKAIELREKQIAQAVQWKKGLMQQMFV
jgi:type I restriction enzyme S subunit